MARMSTDLEKRSREIKLILYFADGFAWQYVQERPFMEDFWHKRRPLETLLGYSSTIMPAIVTGRKPQDTGIWTEYYFEPQRPSPTQRFFSRPRTAFMRPFVEVARLLLFRITRLYGYSAEHRLRLPLGVSHLFSRHPIRYDEFPPIDLPVPTLVDVFRERGLRHEFRYMADGLDSAAELSRLREQIDDVDVIFYYDPTLDGGGHKTGASADALATPIAEIERFLRDAHSLLAEEGEEPEMMLFSDHGMTDVAETFDLFDRLDGFELGRDYVAFVDSTFARFWFPTPTKRAAILDALDAAPGRFLSDEDMVRYGVDFEDRTVYGEEILVADEGVIFHPSYFAPNLLGQQGYPDKAMHGYLPGLPSTDGIFFYRGRRWQEEPPNPFPVTDVFAAVVSILDETRERTDPQDGPRSSRR
jgi:hypothetical protein